MELTKHGPEPVLTDARDRVWLNSDLFLFRINSNGEPEYMGSTGVFRVMQGKDGWRVILYGYMPEGLDLFLRGGMTFEVCLLPCGVPTDHYYSGTIVMRFSECKVVRKWLKHPVSPHYLDVVQGYVEMSCNVWISSGKD